MFGRASIRDVAAIADTSVSTVSNLLNGRPNRMRSDTVQRIEEAIERLGYKPNRSARSLKTGFTPAIGLLVPSVANPFHGAMAHAVEVAAQAHGFQVLLGNSLRDATRERQCAEDFFAFGIRGVIATSSPFDLEHFNDLIGRGLSVVALDMVNSSADTEQAMDSVSMDNHARDTSRRSTSSISVTGASATFRALLRRCRGATGLMVTRRRFLRRTSSSTRR